ncbi:SulP family inorganic anion transporter [Hyphomicrobium facile]|uniref:Sulfate permease, MFS superfamily n=1 Tax=Hyphomicrobium facile TaxID=51670 RepID=A0A1I7MU34_9HYPH|nr:SulP family inorganic anion transporter [Hyphomicrobium facile]SFV25929.1 Sulfate permease, MFS superfamily [Hyphomicrobium facile]
MTMSSPASAPAATSTFGRDFLASIVVFLVALPLCMGISIASGLPPTTGIITGIVGGIIVAAISGQPLQVSGPAAGLTVLVYMLVQEHGAAMLGTIVLFAGLIQIVAGYMKLGQWFRAVSPAVIHGMLAGIGVLIFASQFHVMFDGKPLGSGVQNLIGIPAAFLDAIRGGDARQTAGLVGLLTIVTIVGWSSYAPKSLKLVPAPLVGVVVAVVAAKFLGLDAIKFVDVPSNIWEWSLQMYPTTDKLFRITEPAILIGAISIAFIASAETLLCATAVDQMHTGPRTKYDKELFAQGVGNSICGVLGVLPMTGVIIRSGANVAAGAQTKWSAILHGVWLLLLVAFFPAVLKLIPLSALAAVLVYTGYKLAYPKIVPTLRTYGWAEVAIYAITVITIVLTNLLDGVLVGLGLSLLKLVYAFSHLEITKEEGPDNRVDLHLKGSATLVRLPMLASALEALKPGANVHVHIGDLDYIDHACIDLLSNWDRQHGLSGGSLSIEWDALKNKYQQRSGNAYERAAAKESAAGAAAAANPA